MSSNISKDYISFSKKNIITYAKMILEKQYQKELGIRIRMHSDIINELKDGTIFPQNFSKSEVKKYVKKDK